MTRKQTIIKHIVTAVIALFCSAAIIWLRSGDPSAANVIRYEMFGIVFSTTDFFVIVYVSAMDSFQLSPKIALNCAVKGQPETP